MWIALIALPLAAVSGGSKQYDQGDFLRIPEGSTLIRTVHAEGVQIYRAVVKADDPTKFEWQFKEPEAALLDGTRHQIGRHFAGPSWEIEGVTITAAMPALQIVKAPPPSSLTWNMYDIGSHSGYGDLRAVATVMRVDTYQESMPSAPKSIADIARVKYRATYVFLGLLPENVPLHDALASTTGDVNLTDLDVRDALQRLIPAGIQFVVAPEVKGKVKYHGGPTVLRVVLHRLLSEVHATYSTHGRTIYIDPLPN